MIARRTAAFSLVELLILIFIIAILAGMLLPALANAKGRAQRISCVNNLKQVGLGFRLFHNDHQDKFPMSLSTNKSGSLELADQAYRHFQTLSNELSSPRVLVCPSDSRAPAAAFRDLKNPNVSYFVGLDTALTKLEMFQMFLSGDRNLENGEPMTSSIMSLKKGQNLKWTDELHRNAGNIGLADGSVQQTTSARASEMLSQAGAETNRLVFP